MTVAVELRGLPGALAIGDSVALSGCCSTVTRISGGKAEFQLTRETLARTWFEGLSAGTELNLERALTPTTHMGGHIVQGHVDGQGKVLDFTHRHDGSDLRVEIPEGLRRYCVEKGSIALDGVSLTIAAIDASSVTIALIPHSLKATTLEKKKPGDALHIEVDVLAKYVERLLQAGEVPPQWRELS